jgi:predicted NBD/HSP70 family sugar kinase
MADNDVNLAVLGEHWRGAARGHNTCVFLFVGTGIGAGVLIDGAVHRGHHYMAGEVAVMAMGPQFVGRDFGSRGCFETLAGLEALAARWAGTRGDDPGWLSQLIAAAENGDAQARAAISETAKYIGMAVTNIGAVLDPSLIVLGGAMFAKAEGLLRHVRTVVESITRAPISVVLSELDKDAPLTGSLLLAATEARRQLRLRLRNRPERMAMRPSRRMAAARARGAR